MAKCSTRILVPLNNETGSPRYAECEIFAEKDDRGTDRYLWQEFLSGPKHVEIIIAVAERSILRFVISLGHAFSHHAKDRLRNLHKLAQLVQKTEY